MSERDLKRIEVLTEVLAGRRTVVSAAAVLALGVRQTFRLLARYQEGGRRSSDPQGSRSCLEPPVELRRAGVCCRASPIEVR
jgi:hypothetical protein